MNLIHFITYSILCWFFNNNSYSYKKAKKIWRYLLKLKNHTDRMNILFTEKIFCFRLFENSINNRNINQLRYEYHKE